MSETIEAAIEQVAPKRCEDIVFDRSSKTFFMRSPSGESWTPILVRSVEAHLSGLMFSTQRAKGGVSEVDKEILRLQIEQAVEYAGELAGHGVGILESEDVKFLVTRGPRLIQPVPGNWDTIRRFLERLFGEQEPLSFFYGWLKVALEARLAGVVIPGQACVFAGPAGCGKSLLQQRIITPLLGGRASKPMQYISGKTSFNKDLTRAEHWMMEDEHASSDIRSRRALGTAIKEITVNQMHRLHGKGKDACVSVPLFVRLTLSLNDEAENLMVLPPLDDSVQDKLMLFHMRHGFDFDIREPAERLKFEKALAVEMPHFLHFLLNDWVIDEGMRDTRFGIHAYADAFILGAFNESAPELQLLELLDRQYFSGGQKTEKSGTAAEIQSELVAAESLVSYDARRLLYQPITCGIYLARLAGKTNRVVKQGLLHGYSRWRILPPE